MNKKTKKNFVVNYLFQERSAVFADGNSGGVLDKSSLEWQQIMIPIS